MENKNNDKIQNENNELEAQQTQSQPEVEATEGEEQAAAEEVSEVDTLRAQLADAQAQVEKEKKEYLYLMAEFDNFRKRTIKERAELIKNAGEKVLEGLLPIIDDFERSIQALTTAGESASTLEGVELIYNKFAKYLEQNGVKPIDTAAGSDFDTETQEAVTTFPVDDPAMKNKVIDTVQKGYTLNDKVLRHAKVVVGK